MSFSDHWMFGGNMWIFWIFIVVFVVLVLRMISQQNRSKSKRGNETESPLEILKKRYANGEIDKKEFEQKKKDLLS